ncbi:30S ribosomal protein S7 [Anatilimnocola aggregata]|uniref:Small ribosomal subunit protein uS7 n=1 Tax=Anatilimnocola aggregata TaxID=2528021 RepID=A0A517YJW9_9BACT|nr:30S ribosomal protein S7 [Anatilimnocola aggregata]QDU30507.1 30S ribosomal protein S7 [Anatilimnocola aggregata]
MGKITASATSLKPDPRYRSILAGKFINCLMYSGKKSVAQVLFYAALDYIKEKIPDREPIEVFHTALENVKPYIEVRSRRVGGAAYQVPMQVNRNRQQSLAIRWLLAACREKKGRPMYLKLADELIAAYNKEGVAFTKRENVHRMADANKAFAHFAW